MSNFAKEITKRRGKSVKCLKKDRGNCLSESCNS